MFVLNKDVPMEKLEPGLKRQILGYQSDLMVVRVYFEKGTVAAPHSHPHQQIAVVEKGCFKVVLDGEIKVLQVGDCFVVPPDVEHGVTALVDGILIDTFSPARQDFLS